MLTLLISSLVLSQPATSVAEVPFRKTDDAFIVDATVNGVKVSLLFDTGFGGAVVMDTGINIGKTTGSMGLRDFVGTMEASTVKIKSLSIGARNVTADDMVAVQQPMAGMSVDYNAHIDGIMGFETLKKGVVQINFEKSRLIFYPSSVDITKRVPDNKRAFLAKLLPVGMDSLVMDVRLNNGKKLIMALDTGNAFYVTTHKDSLERSGVWPPDRQPKFQSIAGVATGTVDTFYKRMEDTQIFGVPVKSSVWSVIDRPSSDADADGTVGFQFLKNFNITIDYDRRRVLLENWTGKVTDGEPGSVGISGETVSNLKRVVVKRVSPDSPAAVAGIKEGDQLLSIDGKDLTDTYSLRSISKMLEGDKESKVKLALSRNGQLVRYELVRVPLVND